MLAAAIRHLNALRPRPDLVLITGDLVDEGDPAEYRALRGLLAGLEIPFRIIPGNHDSRAPLRAAFADHDYLPAEGPLRYAMEDLPVRILALDSTIPGLHHGALSDACLEWLDRALAEDPGRPVLVLLHHPPFMTGIPYMDEYALEAPHRLEAVLRRHDHVERVLCGHVHRAMLRRWAGTLVAACPSTTTEIDLSLAPDAEPASHVTTPACLLHHLQADGALLTHISLIGDFPGPYPFA